MTACACGCAVPVTTGSWWATDTCMANWIRKINSAVPLPELGKPATHSVIRTYCGSTYTEKPSVDLPVEMDPDSDTPPLPPAVEGDGPEIECPAVDIGPEVEGVADVSWLARALNQAFGRTA